jgi:hypothetical protein
MRRSVSISDAQRAPLPFANWQASVSRNAGIVTASLDLDES